MVGRSTDAGGASLDELRRFVSSGGALVVVPEPNDAGLVELTGVVAEAVEPAAEWIVAWADRPEAARLGREASIFAPLHRVHVVSGDVEVAATTSVGFRPVPVLTVRSVGQGRVITLAIADRDAPLAHGALGSYVRRLLTPPGPPRPAIGMAVVGYGPHGGMGYLHGLAATETEGLAFVAAVDPVVERCAAAVVDFPALRTYATAAELGADEGVELVVVATPPCHHADVAVGLLEAGKHVVVEKPMCLTTLDADRMRAAATANQRVLTVHQSRRWDTDFLALRRALDLGLVGDVFNIETFVGGFEHPCRAWHSEETISGGAVYDWGSHHIDWILRLYGGPPARVITTSHKRVWRDVTNADQVTVWMHWPDGREATFRQSDVSAVRRPKFFVQGTAGTIEGHYRPLRVESVEAGRGHVTHVHHHAEVPVDLRLVRHEPGYGPVEQVLPPAPPPGWGFHRNLADHLLLGEPLAVPADQSRDVVAVLEAAQRAGAHGSAVVDLDERTW